MSNLLVEPAAWAKQQFAECELGDERRTKRLVQIAAQAAARPDGSTPDQTESWGDCKAVYRLMDCDDVSHAKIIGPHCEQTRQSCPAGSVQLILCDTTEIDFGRRVEGLGRIGRNKTNRGFYLHTGLMRAFDLHLWNRLETSQHAAEVLEIYRQRSRTLPNALALDPGFYRDLQARRRAGTLGAMETTLDPILQMVGIADQLASEAVPELARLLTEAQVARGAADRQQALTQATGLQQRIQESLQQLLLRLEEWNDYQDLIQETRALRDRQRDVQGRTEEARGK